MSFKGAVEARCPGGCEPFEAQAWSVVHGDRDSELKERLLGGEFNLLACPACGRLFYYEHTVVYLDLAREFLAVIYPESFAKDKARWRARASEDFSRYQDQLKAAGVRGVAGPALFFGITSFQEALREEEDLILETAVAGALTRELGLEVYAVSPGWARLRGLPDRLPLGKGRTLRERVEAGLSALVKSNDRLVLYARLLAGLEKGAAWEDPPGRPEAAPASAKRSVREDAALPPKAGGAAPAAKGRGKRR